MIDVTRTDLTRSTELLKVLNRAKFEVEGPEALALAQVLNWAGGHHGRIKTAVEALEAEQEAKIKAALELAAAHAAGKSENPPPAASGSTVAVIPPVAKKGQPKRK